MYAIMRKEMFYDEGVSEILCVSSFLHFNLSE